MATAEIKRVSVQVGINQVVEGFYTITDDTLMMVYSDGEPVRFGEGMLPITVQLKTADNPASIAAVKTREIRSVLSEEKIPGFDDAINYGNAGWR